MRVFGSILMIGTVLATHAAMTQQPTVLHGQVVTRSADRGLAVEIERAKQTGAPAWIGYAIAAPAEFHSGSGSSRITYLEGRDTNDYRGPYVDARYDHVNMLLRVVPGGVQNGRIENPDRQLDAGGLAFVWLTGVAAADSVHVLEAVARGGGAEKLRNDAVFLISVHQVPEATRALAGLAAAGNDFSVREKAAFWLASQRGHDGFVAIQKLARDDPDPAFREKLTFDLTLVKEPAALEELIRMAHSDASPQVRRQAQFWMATAGGKKVADDLRSAAENDPDVEVRKAAVFALTRLPGDEAASRLIQVAQTSKDGEVRRQAVFWLGQSSDPRALDYLTRLIERDGR